MTVSLEYGLVGFDQILAGLERAPALQAGAARAGLGESSLIVEAAAKARVPRRTGRLFSSIESEAAMTETEGIARVFTNVKYAAMVELGTRPHEIAAVNAKALMIPVLGARKAVASGSPFGGARLSGAPRAGQQVAFFRRVHHPGTRGIHFMRDALAASIPAIEAAFRKAAEIALALIARGG